MKFPPWCEWVANAQRPSDYRGPMDPEEYLRWFSAFIVDAPQVPPGSPLTVEQLERMGLVGLYRDTRKSEVIR